VNVTLLPSGFGSRSAEQQFLTSFLVNDHLAVDAGGLGFYGTPQEQARVKHVLISHLHIDHIASLPIFVENAYEGKGECVTIHACADVLDGLRRDVFNDRVWPDFMKLSRDHAPFLKLEPLEPGRTVELEGLRVTPAFVNHVVPTLGFVVADATAAVAFPSDTGPTDEIWRHANAAANLKAVFLEATFPNDMAHLAELSKHLTAATFAAEARKLHKAVPLIAVHIKARFYDQVVRELQALGLPNLEIGRQGKRYVF
jgi:ribonuclease BN (tRNA processing enzyme)